MPPPTVKQRRRMPSITGIGAGATVSTQLPLGMTYYGLMLNIYSGSTPTTVANIKAGIGEIRVMVDGKVIMQVTATELLMLQLYYGAANNVANVAGCLPIYFSRWWQELPFFEELLAWGTADVQQLSVEIDLNGTITGIANIDVTAIVTGGMGRKFGMYRQMKRFPITIGATGTFEYSNLPTYGRDARVGYAALHIPDGSGTQDSYTIITNGNDLYQDIVPPVHQVLSTVKDRTPQSGYLSIPFDQDDLPSSYLTVAGLTDFRQQITYSGSAPGSVTWLAETFHQIPDQFIR